MRAEVLCMDDETETGSNLILSKIVYILNRIYDYDKNPRPMSMTLIIGEDRQDNYDWIGKNLSRPDTSIGPPIGFNVKALPRSETDMSATYIRNLALDGTDKSKNEFFQHLQELGIQDHDIESIYNQIRDNINTDTGKKRKASKPSPKSPSSPSGKRKKTGGATKKKYTKIQKIKKIQKKSKTHRKSKK